AGPEHGGRDRHVAVGAGDLAALARRLDAAGIAYTTSKSGRAALFCRDPDANTIEFVQLG
ncbi:VOC family protein, partial [Thiobacillus sp.]